MGTRFKIGDNVKCRQSISCEHFEIVKGNIYKVVNVYNDDTFSLEGLEYSKATGRPHAFTISLFTSADDEILKQLWQ